MPDLNLAALSAAGHALLAEHAYPGFSIGVVHGGKLVHAEAFGLADIESGQRQDPALRQRIGSITKTMVALCVMALVDEGRLALDDRLAARVPDLAMQGEGAGDITVRHLLTHTAGIGEVPRPEDLGATASRFWTEAPARPAMALFENGLTIDAPPGAKWAYANLGYALLGEIVARAEGAPIEEVLRRRIFAPLGMADTDMLDRPHPDLTTGYHRAPGQEELDLRARAGQPWPEEPTVDGINIRGPYLHLNGGAAGAVQSTIPDMARYAAALLARGDGIVRPQTFEAMVALQHGGDERLESWGLGFQRFPRLGRRVFGHGGGMDGGWNTMLHVVPDLDVALLVHANLYAHEVFQHLERGLLSALIGEAAPAAAPAPTTIDPAILAAAPGVYEARPGRLTNVRVNGMTGRLQIKAEAEGLMLYARRGDWRAGVRMRPADPTDPAFFHLGDNPAAPTAMALVRDAAGQVTGLRHGMLVEMIRAQGVDGWA